MYGRAGLYCVALALLLPGCAGGGLGNANQVIVRLDADSRDVEGATQVAQQTCARRGGRARLVAVVNNNSMGNRFQGDSSPRPPDAVFACDPIR